MKQLQGGGGVLGVRFESQRFRLLSIVVGCFLISVTFLLSSRPESAAFNTLSPKSWLEEARSTPTTTTAIKTVKPSPKLGGRDFLVDVVPQQGAQGENHGRQPRQQSAGEKTETEWVKDTVIIEERTGGASAGGNERAEQEEAEGDLNAAAGEDRQPGVQDEAAPGTTTEEEEEAVHHDDLPVQSTPAAVTLTTGQPAVETTATQPDRLPVPGLFSEKETQNVGGRMMKLQAEQATVTTEQHYSSRRRRSSSRRRRCLRCATSPTAAPTSATSLATSAWKLTHPRTSSSSIRRYPVSRTRCGRTSGRATRRAWAA